MLRYVEFLKVEHLGELLFLPLRGLLRLMRRLRLLLLLLLLLMTASQ